VIKEQQAFNAHAPSQNFFCKSPDEKVFVKTYVVEVQPYEFTMLQVCIFLAHQLQAKVHLQSQTNLNARI